MSFARDRREVRELHAAAALLCASVLVDSAIEHYRGSFENPAMVAPIAASALGLVVATRAALRRTSAPCHPERSEGSRRPRSFAFAQDDRRQRLKRLARGVRPAFAVAVVVGAAGVGFHLYNLLKRPGGIDWLNLFYGAPLGAPGALVLAGAIGAAADRIGASAGAGAPRVAGAPAGRALCGVTALGLAGTVGEVALLHWRGSFQNPFMWLPVSLPPVAAALTAKAAVERSSPRRRRFARAWLRLTALLGIGGVGFHAYGVSRAMGGWRNWSQNVLDGPPLPAPPSFSALALAGLAALRLRDRDDG